MPVEALDHVNICTNRVAETTAFYCDLLDMAADASPVSADPTLARWIRDRGGRAIFHLIAPGLEGVRADAVAGRGGGAIDHIALACTDHATVVARLETRGVTYRDNVVEGMGLRQLFIEDPNGILVELNFY